MFLWDEFAAAHPEIWKLESGELKRFASGCVRHAYNVGSPSWATEQTADKLTVLSRVIEALDRKLPRSRSEIEADIDALYATLEGVDGVDGYDPPGWDGIVSALADLLRSMCGENDVENALLAASEAYQTISAITISEELRRRGPQDSDGLRTIESSSTACIEELAFQEQLLKLVTSGA